MLGGGRVGGGDLLPRGRVRANRHIGFLRIVCGGVCGGVFLHNGQPGNRAERDCQSDERG